ncbi:HTH-type transcriptional regulator DmlR [Acaryochloris thomasi RCC1774]|uniref:HTH-type transcriptional regulator DmlR n=1 Tax=Acaryochloris thomasi RCC1774 TaxID=1764569 RepID=A0A2W1JLT1_9CYAN|nr:LysR family transcriptional regulator [Acaryochloris thomasi]PZD74249.1 HTH-type transcriptional regulator DmlR [Acaryochloris thomasi RCC1774]
MHSLQQLFIQVVEAGSFKKAAEQMHMEPSSLSRKIAALEKHLHVKLLHRSTRHTRPTELGQQYYEGLRRLLDDEIALEDEITSGVKRLKGTLRVSAPVDFGAEFVVPVVHEILKSAPELSVELLLGSHFINLVEQNIDVAVRIGEASKSNLLAKKIGEVSRVLVASHDYLKRYGTPNTPDDLVNHNFILYSPIQARSDIEFADGNKYPYSKIRSNITVNSVNAIRTLVKDGLGIHLGPAWVFKEALENGDVYKVLSKYNLKSFPIHAVYSARAYLPKKTEEFIQQLSRYIERSI